MTDPMSRIETVRRTWDTVERDDRAGLRALAAESVHPDCEWTPLLAGVDGRTYHGPDGMVAFFERMARRVRAPLRGSRVRGTSDDVILASCRLSLESRETGVEIEREIALLAQCEDGLLRRGRAFDSRAEAVEAAKGLLDA